MGTLTLPLSGLVYNDSSAVIYSVERIEPYLTLLAPAWQQAEARQLTLVCSELFLAETLVYPFRNDSEVLEAAVHTALVAPEVRLVAATQQPRYGLGASSSSPTTPTSAASRAYPLLSAAIL